MARYGQAFKDRAVARLLQPKSSAVAEVVREVGFRLTMALLDRLTHHCHIVETGNESYRFQHSSMAAKSRIKSREQKRKNGKDVPPDELF